VGVGADVGVIAGDIYRGSSIKVVGAGCGVFTPQPTMASGSNSKIFFISIMPFFSTCNLSYSRNCIDLD
jgi:hypothetical protein